MARKNENPKCISCMFGLRTESRVVDGEECVWKMQCLWERAMTGGSGLRDVDSVCTIDAVLNVVHMGKEKGGFERECDAKKKRGTTQKSDPSLSLE